MQSLKEYRKTLTSYMKGNSGYSRENLRLNILLQKYQKGLLDFDVFLPTYKCNLQRDYVWNDNQKQELLMSIVCERHIPNCSAYIIMQTGNDKMQIIDGKQRIITFLDFIQDKYTFHLQGKDYLFSELQKDYKDLFNYYVISFDFLYELPYSKDDEKLTDDDKLQWFKFINFTGTPQDKEHLNKFVKTLI
jgi:hypothetical protein